MVDLSQQPQQEKPPIDTTNKDDWKTRKHQINLVLGLEKKGDWFIFSTKDFDCWKGCYYYAKKVAKNTNSFSFKKIKVNEDGEGQQYQVTRTK